MVIHPFLGEVECSDESSFSEGGGPPAEPRGGGVPVCNRHQEEGRGDCDESPFPKRGWGIVMSYPFLGEGNPLRTHGEGLRRWAGINLTLVGRLLFKEGWGQSFKGGVSQGRRGAPPITVKGRGWGADYVNVYAKWVHYHS